MSKINDVLLEAQTKLQGVTDPQDMSKRVVVCYDESDLAGYLQQIKNPPMIGIVYEGMRSSGVSSPTSFGGSNVRGSAHTGISSELVLAFIMIQVTDAVINTSLKKTRIIDGLNGMRNQFMGQRSTVTQHFWHFLVEAPAQLKQGTVCWVQRWSLPIQLPAGS
jgi:hypothetical protein